MALLVDQFVEWVLPIPEVRSLNPVIGKNLSMNIFTDEKTKMKKKRAVMAIKTTSTYYIAFYSIYSFFLVSHVNTLVFSICSSLFALSFSRKISFDFFSLSFN